MSADADEVRQHVRGALDRLLTLTEQTPALVECCPPLTDAIARLTHALVLLEGDAPWPPEQQHAVPVSDAPIGGALGRSSARRLSSALDFWTVIAHLTAHLGHRGTAPGDNKP